MAHTSFSHLADSILRMYELLIGDRMLREVETRRDRLGDRIRLLKMISAGDLKPTKMSLSNGDIFLRALLDAFGLQYATGASRGIFDLPSLGQPPLVGKASDRRGKFKGSEEELDDWNFSLLVRAWALLMRYRISKDLAFEPTQIGRKNCDFRVNFPDGSIDLIECKRIHPDRLVCRDPLKEIVGKISARSNVIEKAREQLKSTSEALNQPVACRHLLIEVTSYPSSLREQEVSGSNVKVIGFSDSEVRKLLETAVSTGSISFDGIDSLTLCWSSRVVIDGQLCALLQDKISHKFNNGVKSRYNYAALDVEAYPLEEGGYREIRLLRSSGVSSSIGRIVMSYRNCRYPGSFFKAGDPIRLGPPEKTT